MLWFLLKVVSERFREISEYGSRLDTQKLIPMPTERLSNGGAFSVFWKLDTHRITVTANMDLGKITISSFTVRVLRWPTSLDNTGTDPMNLAGENSFGYL